MKRTPLKRGSKRLQVRKVLQRGGNLARGKKLRAVGKRGRASRRVVKALREMIVERQRGRCVRCSKLRKLDMHHMLSRARGGSNDESNLVGLCRKCHDDVTFSTPPDASRWILSSKGTHP